MRKAFWILLFISSSALCQQDKLITHFIFDKMSFNPGFTGIELENGFCGTTIYRNQWDKVNGAPNSAILNIQGDLSRYFPGGIGISFYHDAIGFNRQNNVLLNYSYPVQLGSAGILGIGIGFGIMNFGQDPNWIPPTQQQDPSLPSKWSATNLDLNFGLYFKGNDYYVGLSSTHLNQGLLEGAQLNIPTQNVFPSFQSSRHYYMMGGKKFPKIAGGDIDANILLRTDLVKFSADLNARYIYDNKMYGGLTYRTSDAIAFMLGYKPMNELTVGYSYDLTINKLASVSRGTHELFVKYCILLPPPPIQKARHPRWL